MIEGIQATHPKKVIFPNLGLTIEDLMFYYQKIAPYLLTYIKNRPLTFKRFPHGIFEDGFFCKHIPRYYPDYIEKYEVPMHVRDATMIMAGAKNPKALVYFASQSIVEIHCPIATMQDLEKPDQMIFDLDPTKNNDFKKVRKIAFKLKSLLDQQGIPSFVKLTGSRGVHVHIPLKIEERFSVVKYWAKEIARKLCQLEPDLATMEIFKSKRKDKVYIDVLRNDHGMTIISPYSLRATEEASIAIPIYWSELENQELFSNTCTIKNIFSRLRKQASLWNDFKKQSVSSNKMNLALSKIIDIGDEN